MMGRIDVSVNNGILTAKPELRDIITPFLSDFDISWGAEKYSFNTSLFSFIARPSAQLIDVFGFAYEVLIIYSPYDNMQARTMQAINGVFLSDPAKGRVETLLCILVSNAVGAKEWVARYVSEHQDLRSYVVIEKTELTKTDPKINILTELRKQLSERDLFDVQLPLIDDLYFFGREDILNSTIDAIKRCENFGIFGLRKTGKTSFLFKVKRAVEEGRIGRVLFYDAKNLKIRMREWQSLVELISSNIIDKYDGIVSDGLKVPKTSDIDIVERFENIIKSIPNGERVVLIFDEIEFISFDAPLDRHWEKDYFNFWQLLWSVQSECRNFCFIIAGVNPSVSEISSINGIQNPLFSIVHPEYIRGLSSNDISEMARRIGRRMGLIFSNEATKYLHSRYGGHPLLVRLSFSYENRKANTKPITFTESMLKDDALEREMELSHYCQHIVDVLENYYPDEYLLLELLSCGNVQDFIELSTSPIITHHLISYGLLIYDNRIPRIGIPVVGQYIRDKCTKKQGTQIARSIIPIEKREEWLKNSIKTVILYMRQLEVCIAKANAPLLFGANSFPEADALMSVPVVEDENSFRVFITTLSNCFVESIQNYGVSVRDQQYFWTTIPNSYPQLSKALIRIKTYRNWSEHLRLNTQAQRRFDEYIEEDLEGKSYHEVEDAIFIMQQCTLDSLRLAISIEIVNLS